MYGLGGDTVYLTILTPLYNRREYLDKIYESLAAQTNKGFQWLVIDDGSEIPSDDKLEEYKKTADFEIEYYYKKNGGKHSALNFSHSYIKGDVVLILDSDDTLTPDAVETVISAWEKNEDNAELGVISFSKGTDENTPLVKYPEEIISDHITYRINRGIEGDCCETIRREAMCEIPFPEFEGENFMDEIHLWYGTAKKYKTLYINKVIYLAEYLEEGLTKNVRSLHKKNPRGALHNQIVALSCPINFKNRVKRTLLLIYYCKLLRIKMKEAVALTDNKMLTCAMWPVGCLLHFYWERKY